MNNDHGPEFTDDKLSSARGLVNGLITGCVLWLLVIVITLILIFLKGAMS